MINYYINKYGNKYWVNEKDIAHREDGPAYIFANGEKHWFQHGERHRDGGPAIELNDGTLMWFKYGKKHREDGPAVKNFEGTQEWWLDDRQIIVDSQEEFERMLKVKSFW